MADNPRYTRQNIQLADLPEVRLTNIQESVRGSARLEQALDRISATAFKEITEQQQERGMQYGLENAPSLEELNEAVKSGITPAELFQSDSTVFGKYAKKVQAKQVRAQLEYEGRKDFTAIKELINTGQIRDVADLDTELNAVVNGPANMLHGVDAEESLGLKTSLLTRSREVRQYGVGKIVEAQQALFEQELEDFILDTASTWEDKIESMPIKDPNLFKTETMSDALAIINKSGFLGATKQAKTIERVREMQNDTIMSAITKSYAQNPDFIDNPGKYINDVQRGIVGDYTDMYGSLPPEKKKALVKDLRELYKTQYADTKYALEVKTNEQIIEVNALEESYYLAKDPKEKAQILKQLTQISIDNPSVLKISDVKKIKDGEYNVDPAVEFSPSANRFLTAIRSGRFQGYDQMATAASNLGFDSITINKLFAIEQASTEKRMQNQIIESIVLDNTTVKTPSKKQKEVKSDVIQSIQLKMREKDIDFNEAADEVSIEKANDKKRKRLDAAIKNLEEEFINNVDIKGLYNANIFGRDVDIENPAVEETLRLVAQEATAKQYNDILNLINAIQDARKEMDK